MIKLKEEFKKEIKEILKDENEYKAFLDAVQNKEEKKGLKINKLLLSDDEKVALFLDKIRDEFNLKSIPWDKDGLSFLYDKNNLGKSPLHEAGAYYIKEPSSMYPVSRFSVKEGDKVLDLSASPGGKSFDISLFLNNTGLLVSNEVVLKRAKVLSENIERMGIRNAVVISEEPARLKTSFKSFFDKILVDAPCSGEGMFRKNPRAIEEWSKESVKGCSIRQREILREAVKLLRPGGMLLYSTCTFSREEDEDIRDFILSENKDFSLVEDKKLFPHKDIGEGHYYALFKKADDTSFKPEEREKKKKKDNKLPGIFFDFLNEFLTKDGIKGLDGEFRIKNDRIYMVPSCFKEPSGIKIIRYGLHMGEIKGDREKRFIPDHAFIKSLRLSDVKPDRRIDLHPSSDLTLKYLRGEEIKDEGKNLSSGYIAVFTDGFPLGLSKNIKGTLKNHYPKGLRKYL